MVIKSVNTSVTKGAMTASRRTNHFTIRTKTASFQVLKQFSEIHVWIFLDIPRVTLPDNNAEKN